MSWQVDSETGVLRDVLLCAPDNYAWQPTNTIATATLHGGRPYDAQKAQAQFRELEAALQQGGVTCHYLRRLEEHLPYQVYTRDSSQVTPWGPVMTQMFRPQRRGEYASILDFYGAGSFFRFSTAGTLEGGDIHIIRPGLLLVGASGERTNTDGARQFCDWFAAAGWETRVQPFPEHFLHLDVLFCMAADGLAVACPDVLPDDLLAWLQGHGIRIVPASYKEVMQMSCNVLALGNDTVISPRHSVALNARLRAEGLTVLDPELDLFAAGGGSVHCMTMPLRRDPL